MRPWSYGQRQSAPRTMASRKHMLPANISALCVSVVRVLSMAGLAAIPADVLPGKVGCLEINRAKEN